MEAATQSVDTINFEVLTYDGRIGYQFANWCNGHPCETSLFRQRICRHGWLCDDRRRNMARARMPVGTRA